GEARDAVSSALHVGYHHHCDCACVCQNEREIGEALREKPGEGIVTQEDLLMGSRLWCTFHEKTLVKEACQKTPVTLQLGCLDLYLMHWPHGFKGGEELFPAHENVMIIPSDKDFLDTWEVSSPYNEEFLLMLLKAFGFSNFNHSQTDWLLGKPGLKYKAANNQLESHPFLPQEELINFCHPEGISLIVYCPLGAPVWPWQEHFNVSLLDNPQIKEIALKYSKIPAQVLVGFQIQRRVCVILKSVTPHHIEDNFQEFDFELVKENMETILSFKKRY
ncbi:AK1BA reductase, partial [Eudromia elegans]|nr:AK1BA reductase [Eudromia elegans]